MRNPIITLTLDGVIYKIQVIGDPHLGKYFRNNIPKDKLGVLEQHMFSLFSSLLNNPEVDIYVIVGDLFDKAKITNECYFKTTSILETAIQTNSRSSYHILSGNHDLSKDKDKVSSFSILENYFNTSPYSNIHFYSSYVDPIYIQSVNTYLYFNHYNPFQSFDDEFESRSFSFNEDSLSIVFGHWDTVDYGSTKFINRSIPEVILNSFDILITGHEHKPIRKDINNKPLAVVGSMRPYAFGEEIDEDGSLYVTHTAEQVLDNLSTDSQYYSNSCVRILYKDGDKLPDPFDCYMAVFKFLPKDKGEVEQYKPEQDVLSFQNMFLDSLSNLTTDANNLYSERIKQCFLERDYESY